MDRYKFIFVFINLLSICSCEISYEKKNKLVNAFIEFYNSLPNQIYNCEEGFLQNAQQTEVTNSYAIEVNLKVSALHNPEYIKYLKCTSTVADLEDGAAVLNHRCEETSLGGEIEEVVTETSTHTTETPIRTPVQLDNEIQTNIAVTSGEQFIAIPREEPKVSCIGCSSHVNPQAQGVNELASIGVRHLNSIEPNVKHTLHSVVDVERQVQVVNGIRYILTLIVNYNSCQTQETESCLDTKTCKVTILEKPWMPLPDGSKYRAILANNCTEEWLFGDDGVVIPQTPADNREHNNINPPQGTHDTSDIIKPIHNVDVQAQQHTEKTLTDDDIKIIEQQIIPHKQFDIRADSEPNVAALPSTSETPELSKEHVLKVESASPLTANSIPVTDPLKIETLSEERKKAIDDMLSFFNFAGFDSTQQSDDDEKTRLKRSYDKDLNVMNLVEKFKKVKKHLENAKYIYKLAQYVVDYVNEIDLEVKTRVLKDVINAEEEFENHQHFYYIQSRVVIPCDKSVCEDKDSIPKICNAVLDCTDKNIQILSVFCHDEPKTKFTGNVKSVPEDDPVLLKLVKEAIDKIESESSNKRALNLNKIIDANIQRVSGTLTKFTIILNQMNCIKTVTSAMRKNCYTIEELGSQICEVTIHERHWLKERTITYSCEDRPVDSIISSIRKVGVQKSVNDPVILEMAQEALQYLEVQSNRNNKQVVVRVNSVATQLVAGFLTDIEFVVGYTTCTNDAKFEISKCKLLEEEPLRICKAKVWDRTWIEDGRRVDVSCKEPNTKDNELPKRAKRHASMIDRGEHETNSNSINRKKRGVILGGEKKQDPNDPKYRELAEKSMKKYLTSNGNTSPHTVVCIDKVTKQVVSGTKISLDFKITPASQTNGGIINCHSEIWQQPWNNREDINVTCVIDNTSRVKREGLVGGQTDADPNDPKYRELAEKSMKKYLTSNGNTNLHTVVFIDRVTTQVVSGSKIRLDFKITPASQTNGDIINCHSEIWQQPWNNREDINVTCGIDNKSMNNELPKRAKRHASMIDRGEHETNSNSINRKKRGVILGGEKKQDPNDPKYRELAEKSMKKYLTSNGNTSPHTVVCIDKVTKQVVSGTKISLDFKITPASQTNGGIINCHSEIWQQPWNNREDINVTCVIDNTSRVKREGLVGGQTDADPNDPKYRELAEKSMKKYLTSNGNTNLHTVVFIDRVTTQVVSGSKIRLDFKITPASQTNGDIINCHSEIWQQPWNNREDINVTCGIDNKSMNNELPKRAKRHASMIDRGEHETNSNSINRKKRGVILGGEKKQDPNDPKYRELAEKSMKKYLTSNGNTSPHTVVCIDKVTKQVVSGTKISLDFKITPASQTNGGIINCHSEIWQQPWNNREDINVTCVIDNTSRVKREGLVGGQTDADPNDPKYRELAEKSMKKYLTSNGNTNLHTVVFIDRVTTQVVSGSKIRLDFKITPASQTNGDIINCHSEIWQQPWNNREDINVTCGIDNKSRTKRSIPGGQKDADPNDPKYRELAEKSMKKYLTSNGNTTLHRIVIIENVTEQVVAGTKIQLNFKITPADQTNGDVISCHSEIWQQFWVNKEDITVNCDIDNKSRAKRQLPGGPRDQDPNDPKYRELAEKSMRKYLQSNGNTNIHRIVSIEKVTTQDVSGTRTFIKFKMTPTNQPNGDTISCLSDIWQQPWNGKDDITVNCDIDYQSYARTGIDIVGGEKVQDVGDPKFKELAKQSLQKFLQTSGGNQHYSLISIERATVQVVAGTITRLEFQISATDCQLDNQGKPSSSNCKVLDASNVILCSSKIFEQKWPKNLDFDVKCHIDDDNNRIKRELPEESTDQETKHKVARSKIGTFHNKGKTNKARGGINEEDPTKKTYKILAQESLAKYLKIKKITERHRIVEVKKVTSQVVSGMIYNIDFVAAPKACAHDILTCEDETLVLHCNARVLSQLWLNKKEIDVSCGEQHGKRPTRKLKQKDEGINEEERREKRQTADDDYIDDDTKFYYGDRVLKELNDNSHSRNLHKLVTIHSAQTGYEMGRAQVRMYIETVETYCLRHRDEIELSQCEELEGMTHRLCFATIWPSPEDELVIEQINVVCDDDEKFETTTGLSIAALLRASIKELERSPNAIYKLVHQGEPQLIPTLSQNVPTLMNFVVATTNCSKDIQIDFSKPIRTNCFLDITMPSKACYSLIWLAPNNRDIQKIKVTCKRAEARKKRSVSLDHSNSTADDLIIKKLVQESLEKLEMASPSRYKQRMLSINSFSTKITSGKVTTIDFDVGYTSCLKFEWVEDVKTCDLLEHLPRRRCVSQVWERLWINNGRNIEVTCEDDETPLEARVEFENADSAYSLANEALKHIEAKYPHPRKQKVVRIFSLEKQVVAGIHYRMKLEVGSTQCFALSAETNCTLLKKDENNKFCRVNVWLRPWTDHPPNFRVTCDYQEAASSDLYHQIQAEQLFRDFLTVYKPDYINDHQEMTNRFEIFRENIRRIHELNTHERGTARYGLTRFADLSYEEFGKRFLGLKPSFRDANQLPMRQAEIPSSLHIPDKFDWRDYDAVTEVKNQGSCGSCWAFSVTGNIEGQWKMQSGKLVSLSEQELVDCDKLDQGCNGGLPDNAYRAIEQLGGLELENDYPYEGEDDQCAFNKTMSRVQISGAVNITSNETDMAKWLVQNGPISIGINANAMQFYMGGVSHPWKMLCNPGNLDHGVLIVGYGTKNYPVFHKRLPFWTIKNSWGPEWGEQGYYRVYRGDGTCGVNMMASSAVI